VPLELKSKGNLVNLKEFPVGIGQGIEHSGAERSKAGE
jgi:hypothetical protein